MLMRAAEDGYSVICGAPLMYNEIHTLSVWSVKKRKRCK